MQRVVVDTNVWVSALLNRSGAPARVLTALREDQFALIVSQPLLDELVEVLTRPRIARKYDLTRADADELAAVLRSRAEDVTVTGTVRICRDPDDDVLIETAMRGRANALVTRDEDLKGATEVATALATAGVSVLSVQRFLDTLEEERTYRP